MEIIEKIKSENVGFQHHLFIISENVLYKTSLDYDHTYFK